jgi:hypothetical protein
MNRLVVSDAVPPLMLIHMRTVFVGADVQLTERVAVEAIAVPGSTLMLPNVSDVTATVQAYARAELEKPQAPIINSKIGNTAAFAFAMTRPVLGKRPPSSVAARDGNANLFIRSRGIGE